MSSDGQHSVRELLRFYAPLVLTSQMMTLSNPLINLHLSRAADATPQLAAYGVGFGMMVFFNAPLLTLPNVGAGLLDSEDAWRRLSRVVRIGGLLIAAIDLVVALTPVGSWLFEGLLDATPRVADEARRVALALAPLALFTGWRGLRSAFALRARDTALLTQATVCRLAVLGLVLAALAASGRHDAGSAAWSLTLGIGAEAVWIHFRTRKLRRGLEPAKTPPTSRRLAAFALPVVASAYAWTALRPLINGILGRTLDSEAAQASFGVVHPIFLLTGSALWALQSTGQIHTVDRAGARPFLRFALGATLVVSACVMALGWVPPLRQWLLTEAFTLPPELLGYVRPAMLVLFGAPLFLGLRSAFKGMILASGSTGIILIASLSYLAIAAAAGAIVVGLRPGINGALLGILLVIAVEAIEATILGITARDRWSR